MEWTDEDSLRKARASVSRLEAALQLDPSNRGLQINLASMRRWESRCREMLDRQQFNGATETPDGMEDDRERA